MVAIGYSDELIEGYGDGIVDSFTVIMANIAGRLSLGNRIFRQKNWFQAKLFSSLEHIDGVVVLMR
jgi:hypothetical protein